MHASNNARFRTHFGISRLSVDHSLFLHTQLASKVIVSNARLSVCLCKHPIGSTARGRPRSKTPHVSERERKFENGHSDGRKRGAKYKSLYAAMKGADESRINSYTNAFPR